MFHCRFIITVLVFVGVLSLTACSPEKPLTEEQKLDSIKLPAGFHPEGITFGRGSIFYVGSIYNGAIWKGDAKTGKGSILNPGGEGKISVGMDFDPRTNAVYICGGMDGALYVYDGETGETRATVQLNNNPEQKTLINDVFLTQDAAWITNSWQPILYRVSLGPNGEIDDSAEVRTIQLGGEWEHVPFEDAKHIHGINANGIVVVNGGEKLVVMHTSAAGLYAVDPDTGDAKRIKVSGAKVAMGDGLAIDDEGRIYVVQAFLNRVTVVEMEAGLERGKVVKVLSSKLMQIPNSADMFGDYIYFLNGRFDLAPPVPELMPNMDVDFTVGRVRREL